MKLYRVLPYNADAAEEEPGGVFFRPAASTGRIDNPVYRVLYTASTPQAAIAETFGALRTWRSATFIHAGTQWLYALATYVLTRKTRRNSVLCDLDDVGKLAEFDIRPSRVICRDREITQGWAKRIYDRNSYCGISWWSYYNPDWACIGLWNISQLKLLSEPYALAINNPAVISASEILLRERIQP